MARIATRGRAEHVTRGDAGGRERADLRRAEPRAGLDDDGARTHVAAARADVLTATAARDDQVSPRSSTTSTGTTASAPAGTVPPVAMPAAVPSGSGPGGAAPAAMRNAIGSSPRCLRGADGEAVHRGARKRWQVDGSAGRFAKHSAESRVE